MTSSFLGTCMSNLRRAKRVRRGLVVASHFFVTRLAHSHELARRGVLELYSDLGLPLVQRLASFQYERHAAPPRGVHEAFHDSKRRRGGVVWHLRVVSIALVLS